MATEISWSRKVGASFGRLLVSTTSRRLPENFINSFTNPLCLLFFTGGGGDGDGGGAHIFLFQLEDESRD